MSISKAKKARLKLAKQGKLTAEAQRGSWQGVNPATRTTPTLKQKQYKQYTKYKRNHAGYSDDSFFYGQNAKITDLQSVTF